METGKEEFWYCVSTKAGCDPVKTVFLCAPQAFSRTAAEAEAFAERTGWKQQIEEDASLLIMPLSNDWSHESRDRIFQLYQRTRNSFRAPSGRTIPGRDGIVWTWETVIYLVGFEEGADYAGDVLVRYPGMFAGTALIDGRAHDFSAADERTVSWLVKQPSADYQLRNRDISSAVWLFGADDDGGQTEAYFRSVNGAREQLQEGDTEIFCSSACRAGEVLVTRSLGHQDPQISARTMHEFFNHVIRWKNSPDGTLAWHTGREDFYGTDRYRHHAVTVNGITYPYAVVLPKGMRPEEAKGLPAVFSIHGRGEPAWIFAEKNGWEDLADRTREFAVILPDSPQNIWNMDRDRDSIPAIVQQLLKDYPLDAERIYLTGFSNGAVFTIQQSTAFPELYAAASPWNGPAAKTLGTAAGAVIVDPRLLAEGYEMPFWVCAGDSDSKASAADMESDLEWMRRANGCTLESEQVWDRNNHYTAAAGYADGERFRTRVYARADGSVRVGMTIMKNMPHGAVVEESRAAWEFLKRFRRISRKHEVSEMVAAGRKQ